MPYQVPNTHAFEYPLPPFPETWYPICMYNELASGVIDTLRIAGRDLIVYLDNNHHIHVQDRYCPHMGIDLKYGIIQNQCIICPFHRHCIDPKKQNNTIGEKTKNIYVTEDVCNIVFVWIGPLTENKPAYSIKALFKELYDSDESPYLYKSMWLERFVGGHLVDYAEHLLDIFHAPYTHGVELEMIEDTLTLKPHSFIVQFSIKNTNFQPKFTYMTPTFGYVDYGFNMRTFIMFVVEDVGKIHMIQMPIMSGSWTKQLGSLLAAFYTHIDFTEEAAFFSTKKHTNRCLTKKESLMDTFRAWFSDTYYSPGVIQKFQKKKAFIEDTYLW